MDKLGFDFDLDDDGFSSSSSDVSASPAPGDNKQANSQEAKKLLSIQIQRCIQSLELEHLDTDTITMPVTTPHVSFGDKSGSAPLAPLQAGRQVQEEVARQETHMAPIPGVQTQMHPSTQTNHLMSSSQQPQTTFPPQKSPTPRPPNPGDNPQIRNPADGGIPTMMDQQIPWYPGMSPTRPLNINSYIRSLSRSQLQIYLIGITRITNQFQQPNQQQQQNHQILQGICGIINPDVRPIGPAQQQHGGQPGQVSHGQVLLHELVQALRSPTTPEQQQKVLQILRSNPQLMITFIRHRQQLQAQQQGGQPQQPQSAASWVCLTKCTNGSPTTTGNTTVASNAATATLSTDEMSPQQWMLQQQQQQTVNWK